MTTSSDGYLIVTPDNATGSNLIVVNMSAVAPAPTVNLITNPSDEVATGMVAETGTSVARSTAQFFAGVASTALTCTTAGTIGANCGVGVNGQAVSPGSAYTASAYVRTAATARTATIQIDWYTSAGAYISSSVGTGSADSTTWGRRTTTGTAPATARFATVKVTFNSAVLTEVHYVDARQLERGSAATAYCDGSQTGCAWVGTANASMSYRKGYNAVTVRRADGSLVRGLDGLTAPNGVGEGIDHEAPLGVTTTYTASVTNGTATITSTTATGALADVPMVFVKSLRFPAISYKFALRYPPERTRRINAVGNDVLNARNPVGSADMRRSPEASLLLLLSTVADENALSALLDADGPFLLQFNATARIADMYVFLRDSKESRLSRFQGDPYRVYELPFFSVARPSTPGSRVAIPGHTYADSKVAWPLYSGRTGTYLSR